MQVSEQQAEGAAAEVRVQPGGVVSATLRGRLDFQSTAPCWRTLEEQLRGQKVTTLDVDASQLQLAGGIGIALLRFLSEGGMTPGAKVSIHGLDAEAQKLLDTFTGDDYRAYQAPRGAAPTVPEEVGDAVMELLRDLKEQIAFIGSLVACVPWLIAHPRQLRWGEVQRVIETAGANALPVVGVFSFLTGMVLALEAAKPLAKFGAQIFIADMIGFSAIRDTGPLVTAIMLAGRSGSAFAAELGTMKVNEELNALRTMGLNPVRFLVFQRVLASLILSPLLTLYAMLLGIVGGVTILRFQGFPPLMIYNQIVGEVQLNDLWVGLSKALVFGFIVAGVGCLRGLQTQEGPQAVGVSATRSVVAGILLVILANTLFSAVDYFLK